MKRILVTLALILALLIPVASDSSPVDAGYGQTRTVYVQYGYDPTLRCWATAWFSLYTSRTVTVFPCPAGILQGNRFRVTIYQYGYPSWYANY